MAEEFKGTNVPTPEISEENRRMMAIDKASYEMYENTKAETIATLKSRINKETGERIYSDEKIKANILP